MTCSRFPSRRGRRRLLIRPFSAPADVTGGWLRSRVESRLPVAERVAAICLPRRTCLLPGTAAVLECDGRRRWLLQLSHVRLHDLMMKLSQSGPQRLRDKHEVIA